MPAGPSFTNTQLISLAKDVHTHMGGQVEFQKNTVGFMKSLDSRMADLDTTIRELPTTCPTGLHISNEFKDIKDELAKRHGSASWKTLAGVTGAIIALLTAIVAVIAKMADKI